MLGDGMWTEVAIATDADKCTIYLAEGLRKQIELFSQNSHPARYSNPSLPDCETNGSISSFSPIRSISDYDFFDVYTVDILGAVKMQSFTFLL
jgi:hypothetical protein